MSSFFSKLGWQGRKMFAAVEDSGPGGGIEGNGWLCVGGWFLCLVLGAWC